MFERPNASSAHKRKETSQRLGGLVDGILQSAVNDTEVNDMIEDGGREIDREEVPPSTSVIIAILGKNRRLLLNGKKDKEMCFNDNLLNFCMAWISSNS